MNAHVFVDESKAHGLLLAAAVVPAQEVANLRRLIDFLRLPRQRRIHFTAESDARRKVVLAALQRAGVQVTIYDATSHRNIKSARDAALARLVDDAAKIGAQMLIIERDDPSEASDKAIIRSRLQIAGCGDTLRYAHKRGERRSLAKARSWPRGRCGLAVTVENAKPGRPTVRKAAGFTSGGYYPPHVQGYPNEVRLSTG